MLHNTRHADFCLALLSCFEYHVAFPKGKLVAVELPVHEVVLPFCWTATSEGVWRILHR